MKAYLTFTASVLGIYAAALAFIHGFLEIQQGKIIVEGIRFNAIGNGCVPDQIWHACFPAITIWPTTFAAGLITMIISAFLFFFVLRFLQKNYAGWIILGIAVANLLSGGGFIPTFTAIMTAVALFINRKQKQAYTINRISHIILWRILLLIYVLYAAGGWLFSHFLNTFMIENSFSLFIVMDVLTPILCIIFARWADTHKPAQVS